MHHANLLIGSKDWAFSCIPESEKIEGPDILVMQYDRMNITHARTLIHETNLRPVIREYRTFILFCGVILPEAQNALLKLFEEPNAHTIFYLILPREDILLPTLHSRLYLLGVEDVHTTQSGQKHTDDVFTVFLRLDYADRLSMVAERLKAEDSQWINAITHGFSRYAHETRNTAFIKDALLLESYIDTIGSSKKMLLEHIALTL